MAYAPPHTDYVSAVPSLPVEALARPATLAPQYVSYTNDPHRAVTHIPVNSAVATGYYPAGLAPLKVGANHCTDAEYAATNKLFLPVDVHRNVTRQETAASSAHKGPVRNRGGIAY